MSDEQWRPVLDWEGLYEVSNLGRVRSLHRQSAIAQRAYGGRVLRQTAGTNIYPMVALSRHPILRKVHVHVLVLEAFTGRRPRGMDACHANGIRNDNRAENLRWDTKKANQADRRKHGTHIEGSAHRLSKLSEQLVLRIRARHKNGETSRAIARDVGVASTTVDRIIHRTQWKHV